MDTTNSKADSGTAEYYLSRLIQRAIVEPKPLIKIYEEECQRHPDISVTVTYKEFQSALQRHCMTLQSRQQQHGANAQLKQQEVMTHVNKEQSARFFSLSEFADHRRNRRRPDLHIQRATHSSLEISNPQNSNYTHRHVKNGVQPLGEHIKTEEPAYTSPPAIILPPQPTSRPPSLQPPVEEEPPPEFIEVSSNPPRLTSSNQYPGVSFYETQAANQTLGGTTCKAEPKESDPEVAAVGAVQSSSPLDKNTLLCASDVSPLNVRCVKCITALVTCAVMPCGHCCLCNICGQTALSLKQVCPVCRKSISTVIGYSNLLYNIYR